MRLLIVEFKRLWSRRITWVTLVIVSLLMLLFVGIGFTQSSAEEPDRSVVIIDQNCLESFRQFRDVDGDPELQGLSDDEIVEQYCSRPAEDRRFFATSILSGQTEIDDWSEFRSIEEETYPITIGGERYRSTRFGLGGILPGVGTFLLILAVVLGGSFVGAEYRSGTVENLLLWEPRRIRVMLTKYLAGFVSGALVTALLTSWLTILLLGLAQFRGSFQGMDSTFWIDWLATVGRIGLVAGFYFVLAMAIATVAKNTTAAVGAVLGWFVISNILIELFAKWFRQYELFTNANAVLGLGEVPRYRGSGFDEQMVYSHGLWPALALIATWAVVPALLAMFLFRRRDLS